MWGRIFDGELLISAGLHVIGRRNKLRKGQLNGDQSLIGFLAKTSF